MIGLGRPSLARRMAVAFLLFYVLILFAVTLLLRFALLSWDEDNHRGPEVAAYLAADGFTRDHARRLRFDPPAPLRTLAARSPQLWLVADVAGQRLSYGAIPAEATAILARLPGSLQEGDLRVPGQERPLSDVVVTSFHTRAGPTRWAAGGVDPAAISWGAWITFLVRSDMIYTIPILSALGLIAVALLVPLVLRALRPLAADAERVGPDRLDTRLDESRVVRELLPVAQSFNRALDRLGTAFARQRRFVADMAHELRTPVAALAAQVDLLPDGPGKLDLRRGLARLGAMVGQMLDAERLVLADRRREPADLVALARGVAAELAPLAIASGYELGVEAGPGPHVATVDPQAIARALGNVVGNAIAHGGQAGHIMIRVDGVSVEVSDEGPGISVDARERVFEPFRRERWDRDGCGLGLHLVREIMRAHGGDVRLLDSARGARFRLDLPPGVSFASRGALRPSSLMRGADAPI